MLQYNFNWDKLSAVAGITFYNFYFRLYKGSIKSAEVVDFLGALLRHIPGRLLIVWDRLSAHKSRTTQQFIAAQGERLWMEYLPGYAPELNPVEFIWGYWKQHALPNVCPKDYWSLDATARQTLETDASPASSHPRLLATGRTAVLVSLYYAGLNKRQMYGRADFELLPPQQNLWVDSGSGNRPKL